MTEIHSYPAFIAAIVVFQLAPGAGTLTILNASARGGVAAGFGAVAGTLAGDFVYMAAAVLGLAAVMQASPIAFEALQWSGAAYLCWLGMQLLRGPAAGSGAGDGAQLGRWGWFGSWFGQGCMTSLANPKVIVFFLAFFPLFIDADASAATVALMMAHVSAISFLYQGLLVFAGSAIARRLAALPRVRRLARWLAGAAMIGFGVRLAADIR